MRADDRLIRNLLPVTDSRHNLIKKHNMDKIRVAIVGYGNIGRYALQALLAADDLEIAGVVRRNPTATQPEELAGIPVKGSVQELDAVDVAILATPTRQVEKEAKTCLAAGINTVDSFDIHTSILQLRRTLGEAAREAGRVSIIAAGWDPGTDSVVRTMLQAVAPKGTTDTNFGPGMSMGHTVAVKAIAGVRDALSVTIPLGTGIHRRMVYVELEDGHALADVAAAVKADPYFSHDETHVQAVECVRDIIDMGHGVNMVRKGVSGQSHNQLFEFNMRINNPALTGQVLVCAARAAMRQQPGCYTLPEVPVIDLLPGNRDAWVERLV